MRLQSVGMLRNITTFHQLATQAVERTASSGGQKITFNVIKQRLSDTMYKITSQKFEDPADGEDQIKCAPGIYVSICKPCQYALLLYMTRMRAWNAVGPKAGFWAVLVRQCKGWVMFDELLNAHVDVSSFCLSSCVTECQRVVIEAMARRKT